MFELKKRWSKEELCVIAVQILAVYAITSIVSNALYSVSTALLALVMIAIYWKTRSEAIIWPDKMFLCMYIPFFLLILLASVLVGYTDSVTKALDFTYWSVIPFALYYFTLQKKIFDKAIISGIVLGVWTLGAYALYQYMVLPDNTRIQSYLSHPNYLAEMLELSIPFLIFYAVVNHINLRFRIMTGLSAVMACFVLALTASRGGLLGLVVGGIIYIFIRCFYVSKLSRKKILILCASIFIACGIAAGIFFMEFTGNRGAHRSYDYERVLLAKSSYAMWQDHKAVGVGLRHWHDVYVAKYILPEAKEPDLLYPHNTFSYFFTTTGTVGGLGFLLFTFGVFLYLCKKLKRHPDDIFLNALLWTFLSIMLHGLVNAAILSKFVMRLYSTYLGIGLASVVYHEKQIKW